MDYLRIKSNGRGIYMTDGFQRAVNDKFLKPDELVQFLLQIYNVDKYPTKGHSFRLEIEREVPKIFRGIESYRRESTYLTNVLSTRPMRSFRDIDELIRIVPIPEQLSGFRKLESS
jgi:hypothetical protein